MSDEPRCYTPEEVRTQFLEHCAFMVDYWLREPRAPDTREKMESLVFSILVALDGVSMALPSFVVAPHPHEDDEKDARENGDNWYPRCESPDSDIAGELHDNWYKVLKKKGL